MSQINIRTPKPVEDWINKLSKENDATKTEVIIAGLYRMTLLDQREVLAAIESSRTQIKLENLKEK